MSGPVRPSVVLPLRTWLAGSHLVTLFLPVLVVVGTGALGSDLREQTLLNLRNQAVILALHTQTLADQRGVSSLDSMGPTLTPTLRAVKDATYAGVRITNADGVVIASSGEGIGDDVSQDASVQEALMGREGTSIQPRGRPSHNLPLSGPSRRATVRVFLALPIFATDGVVVGAVVVSRTPREEIQAIYNMAGPRLIIGALFAVLITLVAAVLASVMLSRSLRKLDVGARAIAGGSFAGIAKLEAPTASHVREVSRLAESVTSMAVRLQARLGYIGEFASNVSHEFKTPLATLKGTVELLDDDPEMPVEQRQRFLDNAQRELERLESLVQGLLSLARADAEPVRERVELQTVVSAVMARRDVESVGPFGVTLGDAAQLEAVLSNLVENALQHGGDDVLVTIEAPADGCGFCVRDTGRGISPGNLDRVFDRFFTTDRTTGTGLGLALVRAIVERHGGTLSVTSEPGNTCFDVTLPASRD